MPVLPPQFDSTPVYRLLEEAEKGLIGFDRRLIRSLLARREETTAALARFSRERREPALLDLNEQIFDLFRALRDPGAVPYYISLVEGLNGETIPDHLVEAFAEVGAPAVEALLERHAQAGEDERAELVFLLSALGVHDERIGKLIKSALARDPYEGALCAGLYGDRSMKALILAHMARHADDREVRRALEDCLAALNREPETGESEPFDILSLYPEEAWPLFDEIEADEVLEFFASPSPDYRARAAMSFCDDDYSDEVCAALRTLADGDPDPAVRGAALRALGERSDDPRMRDYLLTTLKQKRAARDEWLGALAGLAGCTREPEVHEALLEAYEREDCRATALEVMWRSLDERYRRYFSTNLQSEEIGLRRQAIQGVGAFPLPELALELVPLFQDDRLREEALFSYALAVEHPTTPKNVHTLLELIEEKAGGLSASEQDLVCVALDRRLERSGFPPHFFLPEPEVEQLHSDKVGRNEPCPCGSGKKYKKCCGA